MSEVLEAIAKRSSTRAYTTEKLTEEEVEVLVKAGLEAPTARNEQEIHISVVDGEHPVLAEIDEEKRKILNIKEGENVPDFYYHAPTVLMLSGKKDFSWTSVDAGICVENIAIAAEALGLGSVIIGIISGAMQGEKKAHFAKVLQFPDNYEFVVAIAVGHKDVEKEPHEIDVQKNVTYIK